LILKQGMQVLILKNVSSEGPGTIEDFLREEGIPFRVVDCEKEDIPGGEDSDVLVMMGGPMSVNEESLYPYITREMGLVRDFISAGKKVFGVCLGAQIMAKALGAKVYAGPEKEIGWYDIELADGGMQDPLMKKLALDPGAGDVQKRFKVFHWHGETFDIPEGAVRLAQSKLYPNQAFRLGKSAYAFQFHIEVKKDMIYQWLEHEPVDMGLIRKQTEALYDDYLGRAMNFYRAFFSHYVVE
jgi:GMP synthase (glutamine-hydrolysing)